MRIFFKDGSGINEISKQINSYKSDTYLLTMTDTDAIYIASDFPFNHFFLKMGSVVNSESADMQVSYWSDNEWIDAVNINDYTGAFSSSGFVDFTPDKDESWERSSTNYNGEIIDDLTSINVYDKYWVRIKFNASLTPAIELKWIGNKFSDDDDLYSEYPIFNDSTFLTAYETGKTNWEEQHVKAAELIIADLKRKNIILGKEQILDRAILMPASTSMVASIIYNAFGSDYETQRTQAKNNYKERIDLSKFITDVNNNAILDPEELRVTQGWMSR